MGCKGMTDFIQRDLQGKLNMDEKELLMGHIDFCKECDLVYRQLRGLPPKEEKVVATEVAKEPEAVKAPELAKEVSETVEPVNAEPNYGCGVIKDFLIRELNNTITESDRGLMLGHIKFCAECREAYDQLKARSNQPAVEAEPVVVEVPVVEAAPVVEEEPVVAEAPVAIKGCGAIDLNDMLAKETSNTLSEKAKMLMRSHMMYCFECKEAYEQLKGNNQPEAVAEAAPVVEEPAVVETPVVEEPAVVETPVVEEPAVVETPVVEEPVVAEAPVAIKGCGAIDLNDMLNRETSNTLSNKAKMLMLGHIKMCAECREAYEQLKGLSSQPVAEVAPVTEAPVTEAAPSADIAVPTYGCGMLEDFMKRDLKGQLNIDEKELLIGHTEFCKLCKYAYAHLKGVPVEAAPAPKVAPVAAPASKAVPVAKEPVVEAPVIKTTEEQPVAKGSEKKSDKLGCGMLTEMMQRDLKGQLNLDEKELLMGHIDLCKECLNAYCELTGKSIEKKAAPVVAPVATPAPKVSPVPQAAPVAAAPAKPAKAAKAGKDGCGVLGNLMQRDLKNDLNMDEKELLMGHLDLCAQCMEAYCQLKGVSVEAQKEETTVVAATAAVAATKEEPSLESSVVGCGALTELIQRDLDGELNLDEKELLSGHLTLCRECRDTYNRIIDVTNQLKDLPDVKPPVPIVAAVLPTILGNEPAAAAEEKPVAEERPVIRVVDTRPAAPKEPEVSEQDQDPFRIPKKGMLWVAVTLIAMAGIIYAAISMVPSNNVAAPPNNQPVAQNPTPAPADEPVPVDEPATEEPAGSGNENTNVVVSNNGGTGTTTPGVTKPAPTKPGVTKPAPTKPGVTKPAPTKPGVTKPAPTKPEVTKPAPTKPTPAKPAPTNPGKDINIPLVPEVLDVLVTTGPGNSLTVAPKVLGLSPLQVSLFSGDPLIKLQ